MYSTDIHFLDALESVCYSFTFYRIFIFTFTEPWTLFVPHATIGLFACFCGSFYGTKSVHTEFAGLTENTNTDHPTTNHGSESHPPSLNERFLDYRGLWLMLRVSQKILNNQSGSESLSL